MGQERALLCLSIQALHYNGFASRDRTAVGFEADDVNLAGRDP